MDQLVCFANVLSVLSLDILGGENKMRHASNTLRSFLLGIVSSVAVKHFILHILRRFLEFFV